MPLLVGIGELLWDLFPQGPRLGGAPGNFAAHAARLGCRGAVASRVGDDPLGRAALRELAALGVEADWVQVDPELPTGTVEVAVDAQGQPTFDIRPEVAWDALDCTPAWAALAAGADAICFGTMASRGPRSLAAVQAFLAAAGPDCLRIFDVNLRPGCQGPEGVRTLLAHCDVLKVNEDELPRVAALAGVTGDLAEGLRARFGLRLVAVTLGAQGSRLCVAGRSRVEPPMPVAVADTVGAGDAFTAVVAAGLVQGWDLETLHRRASRLSAYVCSQTGATPDTRAFLATDPGFH